MADVFPIVPASGRGLWVLVGAVLVLLAGVSLLLVTTARGARHSVFELSDEGLRIRGDLYGRTVAAAQLRGGAARLVDVRAERELQPRYRTLGTATGSYQSGWFRLRTGEKALLYLTDRSRAVYVPTTAGYSLLLSPREPERFVERLRAIARAE